MILSCCGYDIKDIDVWILKDIKDFTARKLFFAQCPKCHYPVISLCEKRIADGKVFINANIRGKLALNTIYREEKRVVTKLLKVKSDVLFGWIYGHNVEIRNKNKQVTQIRQYAKDFSGNKNLTKKVYLS